MVSLTRDCVRMETDHHVPFVALATDAFVPQAKYQAAEFGMLDAAVMFVQHPLSDTNESIMHKKGDAIYDNVVKALISDQVYRSQAWISEDVDKLSKKEMEKACME